MNLDFYKWTETIATLSATEKKFILLLTDLEVNKIKM